MADTVTLPSGERVPALGQGTWTLAERPEKRAAEIAALRTGIELGMTVIDTAEAYADGESEILVGEAITGVRDDVFLVSKVLPRHSSYDDVLRSCDASLDRLGTDRLDLYLLHWPRDEIAVADETFAAFEHLVAAGKTRYWGVSNFALADLEALAEKPWAANNATNQILYNLHRRGPALDVLPWCHERRIPVMAYSPIESGRMIPDPTLHEVASRHDATAVQVALAWLLRQPGLLVIPKAGSPDHVLDNHRAIDLVLTDDDLGVLDAGFPAPAGPIPFEMN